MASLDPFWFIVRRLRSTRFYQANYLRLFWPPTSEAKSDLTNDFVMAKYPFLALFGILLRLIGLL